MKQSTAECRPNQKHGHQLKHDRKKGTEVENYDITDWKIKGKLLEACMPNIQSRLGLYTKLELVEVEDEKTPDQASDLLCEQIKDKEGDRLLARCPKDGYVIALAIDGKQYDSVALSKHLEKLTVAGRSHLVFVIGGSLGLSKKVLARADEKLSFSALTFPHQMMRVILLEQIYRCFRIQKNEPYHK